MDVLRKLLAWYWCAMDAVIAAAMVVMIILVFTNVILRYGFGTGVLASAEISRFLFVWIIMLGAVLCMRDGSHLDLRVIEHRLPDKVRWILRRAVYAIIVLASGMLFLGSARQTEANWPNISPMSGIPVGVLYLAGAVGGGMMAAIAAYRFFVPRHDAAAVGDGSE